VREPDRTRIPTTPNHLHHASFVLRCWTDRAGDVRLRLIDARSGLSYPLAQLADLAELVQRLVLQAPPMSIEIDADDRPPEGR